MWKQILAMAALFALNTAGAFAQSKPVFEVASIRQAMDITPAALLAGKVHLGMKTDASRVDIGFLSLKELIPLAYGMKPYQVMGGPEWLGVQRFDIVATMPEGATKEQIPAMLQALLAERFHLKAHKENKEQNVYALVQAKGGHKMQPSPTEPDAPPAPGTKSDLVVGVGENQMSVNRTANGATLRDPTGGVTKVSMGTGGMMRMEMSRLTMDKLAEQLTPMLDKPVVDMTELQGPYQVVLELSMQDMMAAARASGALPAGMVPPPAPPTAGGQGAPTASDPSGGTIFNTVQQLGLRLESRKAPAEIIVVDSVDKNPTEN